MKKSWIFLYFMTATLILAATIGINKTAPVFSEQTIINRKNCVIIDAGHGGVDGGAISGSGEKESNINLTIAIKLNDMLHFLGYETKMIRDKDISVYTEGTSIAQKKISDLKERARVVTGTPGAILISIHQNYFAESKYSGAQVFHNGMEDSKKLAQTMQHSFALTINPNNTRKEKECSGIYLMDTVKCTAVLVECGFLSNPEEERMLKNDAYQKGICAVIACATACFLSDT